MVGRVLLPCDLSNFMGDVMNPLSPNQILRNLENGYFMTHQEQSEAAQYIRQLQQENLTLLGKTEIPMTPEHLPQYIATNNIKPTTEGGGGAGGELAKPEPVQVTPHEFIAMASKQANMIGTPVVWAEYPTPNKIILDEGWEWGHETEVAKPEREWVGLTDDEVDLILWQGVFDAKDIRTIEAKLKEKNNGSV